MQLELHPNRRWSLRKRRSALNRLRVLNRMHRLRLHPRHAPPSLCNRHLFARVVPHTSVRSVVPEVRRAATGIPNQKEARPAMMMHRLFRPRRHRHLQHPHKRIFKKNPMTVRRNLHRIVAVRKTRFVLPQRDANVPQPEPKALSNSINATKLRLRRLEEISCSIHDRQYTGNSASFLRAWNPPFVE